MFSRRDFGRSCFTAAFGLNLCGCESAHLPAPPHDSDGIDQGLKFPSSMRRLADATAFVDEVLLEVYKHPLPNYLPNWIVYHALLMFGSNSFSRFQDGSATESEQRLFSMALNLVPTDKEPFTLRSALPIPNRSGEYFSQQHHPGQFLGYFALAGGDSKATVVVEGREFEVADVVRRQLLDSDDSGEFAYQIISLSHFLKPNQTWRNKYGELMSLSVLLERLLRSDEATCLGTHRMAALACVFSRPELFDDPRYSGMKVRLCNELNNSLKQLKRGQDSYGLFPLPGLAPGSEDNMCQALFFGGHSVEWITLLDDEVLLADWVVDAVFCLAEMVRMTFRSTFRKLDIIRGSAEHFDFDGLSHAVSGLRRWMEFVDSLNEKV